MISNKKWGYFHRISPEQYEEFVVPYYSRIFETFGGGSIHFCGDGSHMGESLLKVKNLRVINNSPLGNFDAFGKLYKTIGGKVTIQLQDAAPILMDEYYDKLFERITDLRGIMLGSVVLDTLRMDNRGSYEHLQWDTFKTANRIVKAVRNGAKKVLLKNCN